jgi:hypothetical protein
MQLIGVCQAFSAALSAGDRPIEYESSAVEFSRFCPTREARHESEGLGKRARRRPGKLRFEIRRRGKASRSGAADAAPLREKVTYQMIRRTAVMFRWLNSVSE